MLFHELLWAWFLSRALTAGGKTVADVAVMRPLQARQ